MIEQTTIISTKGRDSKYSSKIYIVKIEQKQENDLDKFFGPVQPIQRLREYQSTNYIL
jgi:hypothetical protein